MADVHETDTDIARGKIMKLIEELKDAKGNGNSLLSIFVPPHVDDLFWVTFGLSLESERVTKELPQYHEYAIGAITCAQQKLQLYSKVPPNGLFIYNGIVVTDDGITKEVSIEFEPYEPMHASFLCVLDNKFNTERLSELLEYEDNYVRENDKNIAMWKIQKLMKALQFQKGHGTSLISIVMEPGEEISEVMSEVNKMLDDTFVTASTMNMYAIRAITSAQQILKRYTKVPPNGLVIYNGTVVTHDGKDKDVAIEFEPYKPIDDSICLLHHRFHIESLTGLLEPEPKYGFIVMIDKKALFGKLMGNRKKILCEFTVNPPMKQRFGADDQENNLHMFREWYLRRVVDLATNIFIQQATYGTPLLLAVSPSYHTDLIDRLGPHFENQIVCVGEVSYGGMDGFNTAIERSSNYLYHVRIFQEIHVLKRFMKEMSQDTSKYVIGVEETLHCLSLGAVKILIVWENLDINRYVLKNSKTSEIIIRHWNKDQEADQSNFRDLASNAEFKVQEKKSLVEWFAEEYKNFGCKSLEFVMNDSREGSMFCRGLGGIGGILHYQLDTRSFDNLSGDEENYS